MLLVELVSIVANEKRFGARRRRKHLGQFHGQRLAVIALDSIPADTHRQALFPPPVDGQQGLRDAVYVVGGNGYSELMFFDQILSGTRGAQQQNRALPAAQYS